MSGMDTTHGSRFTPHASTSCPLSCWERVRVRDDRGFTLIELIIVIALIGIISAIATPQLLQLMPGMRVNAATRQVTAKMLLLKMRAVSENRSYQIEFRNPGANQYRVRQDGNRDGDYSDTVDTIVETENLPAGIIFDSNATKNTSGDSVECPSDDGICFSGNSVSFTGKGTADLGSVYLMPQEDIGTRNDRMRAISVNPAGRVKAWKYKGGTGNPWTGF